MSNSTTILDLLAPDAAQKEVQANAMFDAASPAMLFGRRASTTSALTWGYYGGRYRTYTIANGTLSLTASTTNYVVAARSDGAVSVSTATTNWNDTANYLRLYLIVTGTATVTSYEDHRQAVYVEPTGVQLYNANVYTKAQTVTPVTLTSGATVNIDASLSNNFKLVLATNATLANPTNLSDGMTLNIKIKQDATGGRTLAYGSMYKFPGGTVPVLSTAASYVDLLSCIYDATDGILLCTLSKGYA